MSHLKGAERENFIYEPERSHFTEIINHVLYYFHNIFLFICPLGHLKSPTVQKLLIKSYCIIVIGMTFGVGVCKNHVEKPWSHWKSAVDFFCQAGKLVSAEIWKIMFCHFWADVMTSRPLAPLLMTRGGIWECLCSKNFSRAKFYIFRRAQMVNMILSCLPVKQIWRKSTVWNCYNANFFQDILSVTKA